MAGRRRSLFRLLLAVGCAVVAVVAGLYLSQPELPRLAVDLSETRSVNQLPPIFANQQNIHNWRAHGPLLFDIKVLPELSFSGEANWVSFYVENVDDEKFVRIVHIRLPDESLGDVIERVNELALRHHIDVSDLPQFARRAQSAPDNADRNRLRYAASRESDNFELSLEVYATFDRPRRFWVMLWFSYKNETQR